MKKVLADTGYWIALLNPADDLHSKAKIVTASCMPSLQIVTSEMIFTELLNAFASKGGSFRQAAANLIHKSLNNPNIEVLSQTRDLFISALELYNQCLDQAWSHTDCTSFKIMQEQSILEALSYDKHFEQAGFVALLRQN